MAGCRVRWRGGRGLALEVAEPGVDGLPNHGVDLGDQGGPVLIAVFVARLAGQAGVLAQGGVENRDRVGQRQGQVEEQRALPGLLDGLGAEFAFAVGGGVRLGGQQLGVQVGGLAAVTRRPAERGAVGCLSLAEQQIVRFALDGLAGLEAERSGAGSPPAAGWFSPGLAGLDVVASRVLGRAAVDLLPDVVKVIALAQRRDNRQPGLTVLVTCARAGPRAAPPCVNTSCACLYSGSRALIWLIYSRGA